MSVTERALEILRDAAAREARFHATLGNWHLAHALYTTAADRLGPLTEAQAAEAARIARCVQQTRAAA